MINDKDIKSINQKPSDTQAVVNTTEQSKAQTSADLKPAYKQDLSHKRQMSKHQRGYRQGKHSEFEKRIISIRRVSRVYSGGKRLRMSVCVVIGDRKGRVGIGMGKGLDIITAEDKAINQAKRNLKTINLKGKTIPHEMVYKRAAVRIILKPAAPGTGVIAGAPLRAVLELTGIEDILTKSLGSTNQINNAYACYEALLNLKKTNYSNVK